MENGDDNDDGDDDVDVEIVMIDSAGMVEVGGESFRRTEVLEVVWLSKRKNWWGEALLWRHNMDEEEGGGSIGYYVIHQDSQRRVGPALSGLYRTMR